MLLVVEPSSFPAGAAEGDVVGAAVAVAVAAAGDGAMPDALGEGEVADVGETVAAADCDADKDADCDADSVADCDAECDADCDVLFTSWTREYENVTIVVDATSTVGCETKSQYVRGGHAGTGAEGR